MIHILPIHSPIKDYFGCFEYGANRNKAALNTHSFKINWIITMEHNCFIARDCLTI